MMMNICLDKNNSLKGKDMKLNKKMVITAMVALCTGGFLQAKVRAVRARRDFEQTVSKGPMVVALFYEEEEKRNGKITGQNKGLMRMYEDLSGYQLYDDADVIFLKANVGRKDLSDLATLYGITRMPTFVFFQNGKRVTDSRGFAVNLEGFISRVDLQSFIDQHYGSRIRQYVANKENRRQQILAEENESWMPYFYPRDMVVRGYSPEETQENME